MQNFPDHMTRVEHLHSRPLIAVSNNLAVTLELTADDDTLLPSALQPFSGSEVYGDIIGRVSYMDAIQMMRDATDLSDEEIIEDLAGPNEQLAAEMFQALESERPS